MNDSQGVEMGGSFRQGSQGRTLRGGDIWAEIGMLWRNNSGWQLRKNIPGKGTINVEAPRREWAWPLCLKKVFIESSALCWVVWRCARLCWNVGKDKIRYLVSVFKKVLCGMKSNARIIKSKTICLPLYALKNLEEGSSVEDSERGSWQR